MLARPFLGMSRGALRLLLVFLIVLEIALGAGLYMTSKNADANSVAIAPSPTVTPSGPEATKRCTSKTIRNSPKTVVVGQSETFSACLPDLPNVLVTYKLTFPDRTSKTIQVLSDVTGYSKQIFQIKYRPQSARDTVGISVSYHGLVQKQTRFAVQIPEYSKK